MIKYAIILVGAIGFIILVLVAGMPRAKAADWPQSEFSATPQVRHHAAPVRYKKPRAYRPRKAHKPIKRRHAHGKHPAAVVKAWSKLDAFQGRDCREVVEAIGQRRSSNDRAMDDAREHWHQIVTAKYGVMHADIENAHHISAACVSVSRPGVLSNASEVLTREKFQDRQCILKAKPCGPKEFK